MPWLQSSPSLLLTSAATVSASGQRVAASRRRRSSRTSSGTSMRNGWTSVMVAIVVTPRHPDPGGLRSTTQHHGAVFDPVPPLAVAGALDRGARRCGSPRVGLGGVGEASGFVDRIADHRVFVAVLGADV